MTSEERAPKFHTDATRDSLVTAENLLHPIRSTTQIWIVTRHHYRTSALLPQTSFRGGETSGGIAKYRLFSQALSPTGRNNKPKLNAFFSLTCSGNIICTKRKNDIFTATIHIFMVIQAKHSSITMPFYRINLGFMSFVVFIT